MKPFELTTKIREEINKRNARLNDLERKKRGAVLEREQAKETYVKLVADGAGQHEIDKAYNLYKEKLQQHERFSEEYDIMSNSDSGYTVTGEEFSNKYSYEYVPAVRQKHLDPIIKKLEETKIMYLEQLGELESLLSVMELEHRKADNIMNKKAFRGGENNNIRISLTLLGHITNEQIDRAIITDHEMNKHLDRYLL